MKKEQIRLNVKERAELEKSCAIEVRSVFIILYELFSQIHDLY